MDKSITLNFLPIGPADYSVPCFCRPVSSPTEARQHPDDYLYVKHGDSGMTKFWLTATYRAGFAPYRFRLSEHPGAGTWALKTMLSPALIDHLNRQGCHAAVSGRLFGGIDVKVKQYPAGWQGFKCEFTWIPSIGRHGLLVRFHFFRNPTATRTADVQKLSLSVNKFGSPNKDMYADLRQWLAAFFDRFISGQEFSPAAGMQALRFEEYFQMPSCTLRDRTYVFQGGQQSASRPYFGIRSFGPYRKIGDAPTFVFVFRNEDRDAARFLYFSLLGSEYPEKFPGMGAYFGTPFSRENIRHVEIKGHTWEEYSRVVKTIDDSKWKHPVCIVLMPGGACEYYLQKSIFLKHGIPTQDVLVSRLSNKNSFQWSISGLALQLFCKAGGIPWCVQTQNANSLIMGISQLWDDREGARNRLVAYSVTTDASGLFRDIRTLSNQSTMDNYVADLAARLKAQLIEWGRRERPDRIVLHCSFRLKKRAMNAIRRVVAEIRSSDEWHPKIVVTRVDFSHPYLGFDVERGSCVPRENSYVKLGNGRFLLWTDGAVDTMPMRNRPSYPLYVCIDRSDDVMTDLDERAVLDDLGNLAGVNWRGFNARAKPASVNYCQLVGDFIHELSEQEGAIRATGYDFQIPELELVIPWFL